MAGFLLAADTVDSQWLDSYWPQTQYILNGWFPIGRRHSILSMAGFLLAADTVYSQWLVSYWPQTQ
jgi:hypothetical protein